MALFISVRGMGAGKIMSASFLKVLQIKSDDTNGCPGVAKSNSWSSRMQRGEFRSL